MLPELVPWVTLSGSNYPCLKWISMVPKMFEPLRFDCIYFHEGIRKIFICMPSFTILLRKNFSIVVSIHLNMPGLLAAQIFRQSFSRQIVNEFISVHERIFTYEAPNLNRRQCLKYSRLLLSPTLRDKNLWFEITGVEICRTFSKLYQCVLI